MTIKAKLHKNRDRKRERQRQTGKTITTTITTTITRWPLLLEKVKRERGKNHPLWDENKETHFKEFNTITL